MVQHEQQCLCGGFGRSWVLSRGCSRQTDFDPPAEKWVTTVLANAKLSQFQSLCRRTSQPDERTPTCIRTSPGLEQSGAVTSWQRCSIPRWRQQGWGFAADSTTIDGDGKQPEHTHGDFKPGPGHSMTATLDHQQVLCGDALSGGLALTLPVGVNPSYAALQRELKGDTQPQPPTSQTNAAAENAALVALATALGEAPHTVCQVLADNVLALLKVGSAGVSVLSVQSDGGVLVSWPAIAGRWLAHSGSSRMLLAPAPPAMPPEPTAEHYLAVPFGVAGTTLGTVWAVAHDAAFRFTAEDLRQLQNLALFTAPALQALAARRSAPELHGKLETQRGTFNSLIENAPFGVYVVDAQFCLSQASAAAHKAFASVQPLIGRPFGDIVRAVWPEPFASEVLAHFRRTLDSGKAHAQPTVSELRKDSPHVESYDWKIERIVLPDGAFGVLCYFYDLTERQQAAEALRLRTAQFETLVNEAPLGIYLVDAQLRIRQVNPLALPEFGNIQGLIGSNLAAVMQTLWGPARADEIVRQFRHTLTTGEPLEVAELIALRADRSTTAYYEWQIHRIPLPNGSHGVVCYFRDISTRVHAQAAIRDSELRLRAMVSASSDVVYRMNADWTEMLHLQGREFIVDTHEPNRSWLENYILPGDQQRVTETIREAVRTQSAFELEHQILRIDGTLGWTFSRAIPLMDKDGTVVEWFGTASDVTARKQAQDALGLSEQKYRTLFESMDEGYCVIEMIFDADNRPADFRFLETNPAFEKQSGLRDAQGRRMREMAPDHDAYWFETYGRVAVTGEAIRFVNEATALDGRWFDVYAFRLGGNGSHRVALLFNDITDRKRGDEERERLVARLQQEDQRKDEFLATLAHELRNPLAPIRNGLQIMRLAPGDADAIERIRSMMERQLGQMVHLIDDLLDLSRISRGKIDLRKERIDLATAIQQAIEASRPSIAQADHELLIKFPPGPIHVDADPTRLAQVFSNLLNNAAKFTDRGGQIRLSIQHLGAEAVVSIQDNGSGIPTHMLPHVFEMFTQVDSNLERSQGGLGIGLSIVKRLVEMHGGSVEARSEGQGRGSEFVVRLPVALSVAGDEPTVQTDPVCPITRHRILVVDDNVDAANSLSQLLEMLGNEVITFYDGESGIQAARKFRPSILLCDIGMPKMNGYDTARSIRAEEWGKNTVLVALTGYGQMDDLQRSADAGFDHHLVKPLDVDALMALLAGLPPQPE